MSTQPTLVGYISDTGDFLSESQFKEVSIGYQSKYTPVFKDPLPGGTFSEGFKAGLQEAVLYHKRELNHYGTNSGQVNGVPFPLIAQQHTLHLKALQARLALLTDDASVDFLLVTSPEEFMREYVYELESGGEYHPSESERALIADAIAAYTSDRNIQKLHLAIKGD